MSRGSFPKNSIPKNWRRVRLGEVADVNAHSISSNFSHKKIKYIDISAVGSGFLSGMTEYELCEAPGRARRLVMDGDTILSTVRPNRRSFLYIKKPEDNTVASTGFAVLSPKKETDSRFLYYLVTRQQFSDYLSSNVKGSAYPAVSPEVIADAEVLIPSSEDQKRIADVLSAFDDKIELNNKVNQTLEQMAQAIFKEWFAISPESLAKEGGLPNGLEITQLDQIATIEYGKGPSTKNLKKTGRPVYGANGIIGYYEKYDFEEPQIIVGCRGVVGSLFKTLPKASVTHNSLIIKPSAFSEMNYLFWALKNSNLQSVVGGSAQPQITIKELSQLPVLFAKQETRRKFEKIAGNFEQKRLNITYENQKLASLRDFLLPKLVSGEMVVKV